MTERDPLLTPDEVTRELVGRARVIRAESHPLEDDLAAELVAGSVGFDRGRRVGHAEGYVEGYAAALADVRERMSAALRDCVDELHAPLPPKVTP
jgi:5-formyltetrahydrofolate cyclo-ligase